MKEYGLDPKTSLVVYIPTAENCFSPPRQLSERGSYQCLIERGFTVTICDLDTETPEKIKEKMKSARVVVCAGGNTFYLLYHMKESGFHKLLPSLLENDVIYVGSSAGSCVCSPDISYVKDEDDPSLAPELKDFTGLSLVNFEIYPHCTESIRSISEKIYLRDNQAIVVNSGGNRIVST
jgi:dipeptidase E